MNNATEILTHFEKELIAVIDSREATVESLRRVDAEIEERYCKDDPETVRFNKLYNELPMELQTTINLEIDTEEVAEEVYRGIQELIKAKDYPIEETMWIRFCGSKIWCFQFNY